MNFPSSFRVFARGSAERFHFKFLLKTDKYPTSSVEFHWSGESMKIGLKFFVPVEKVTHYAIL